MWIKLPRFFIYLFIPSLLSFSLTSKNSTKDPRDLYRLSGSLSLHICFHCGYPYMTDNISWQAASSGFLNSSPCLLYLGNSPCFAWVLLFFLNQANKFKKKTKAIRESTSFESYPSLRRKSCPTCCPISQSSYFTHFFYSFLSD